MAGHQRASLFLEGPGRRFREIETPEGVLIPVELASYGERAAAFLLDLFFWLLATVAVAILIGALIALPFVRTTGVIAITVLAFMSFFIRNIYFIHFELAWQGATPGKRLLGLRVVDRAGGPLLPGAVIARNLTREMEAFLPLALLLTVGGAAAWQNLLLGAWLGAFALLPLFNRDRMRGGDFIAGTIVIAVGKRVLEGDLAEAPGHFAFTGRQLDAYGAFELQVLEELLRAAPSDDTARLRREVCDKICRKIGWPGAVAGSETDRFLRDFYTAERAHLERAQLFGKGREDKDAGKAAPAPAK
jgi:uncharacterized RDD family membrane protein YckC